MTDHPIPPPPELVQQWVEEADTFCFLVKQVHQYVAHRAAQWGADQELEACCEWLDEGFGNVGNFPATLRAARRPKPPSLKEQALETLKYPKDLWSESEVDTIRRALEQLDD